jgi:hypothetical protein
MFWITITLEILAAAIAAALGGTNDKEGDKK